jgi:hypothetical protein
LKNTGNSLPERLPAYLLGIKAFFKPGKTTSHNLHYVRFTILPSNLDSDEYEVAKNLRHERLVLP